MIKSDQFYRRQHGHSETDLIAELLSENVCGTVFVGRLGGDEFAILLTRSGWQDGLQRAEAFDALTRHLARQRHRLWTATLIEVADHVRAGRHV